MRRILASLAIPTLFLLAVCSVAGAQTKISTQGARAGSTPAAPPPSRIDYIAGSAQKIKIMPLGDSITFGSPDPSYGGYRHLLGTLLTNDGYTIDFVGSRQNNEGHPGWTIPQIAARRLYARDPLRERVRFAGEVRGQAKAHLFAESDLAVFPSHTENFAMVVAEALAHGVPVIASKGTPWSGVERHGCGLWVENDPATLAAAIERMSHMPLVEMGERGRHWMEEEFAWETVAREMLRLYGKLVLKEQSAP